MSSEAAEGLTSVSDRTGPVDREELLTKALELLEFPKICHQLADRTFFLPARELALGLAPAYRPEEVSQLQQETSEAALILEQAGDPDLSSAVDPRPLLKRAALGGMLTGPEFLEVVQSLEVIRRARSVPMRFRKRAPSIAALARAIPDLKDLRRQIKTRIGRRGEVVDSATPILADLRQRVRLAYQRLTDTLTRIIQSPPGQETLQDQVISTRGERLVLPVKVEMRHRLPGIVHDASHSGATLFIEPFSTVALCNAWRELALEEGREVERVLRDLSERIGALAPDILLAVDLTARLDLILAKGRYSTSLGAVAARPSHPDGRRAVHLSRARHPLLGDRAVPINLDVGPGWSVVVITGPNTGGKTVAMKTVGLLALMYQSGLYIPADRVTSLPVFDGIYADVGDQQSIERSVSTFSSHMRNVIDILSVAGPDSLVLLDELGTSTDPEEGSALARAILTHLAAQDIATVATTHHRTVAAFAEETPGMMNASVELDPATLRPTYQLTMGVPGRSYAMSVADSLGLPQEVLQRARSLLDPQHLHTQDMLAELQRERHLLQAKLMEAEEARSQSESVRRQLELRLEEIAAAQGETIEEFRRELAARSEEIRRRLRRAEGALAWGAPPSRLQQAKAEVSQIRQELKGPSWRPPRREQQRKEPPLLPGDRVEVKGLGLRAEVVSTHEEDKKVEVLMGNMRLRLEATQLSRVGQRTPASGADIRLLRTSRPLGAGQSDLDIRGLRAEEALVRVDAFLDQAVLEGQASVRIVHGHGTGSLRQAVRERLHRHPLVKTFEPAGQERGGDGATLVELR